MKVLILSLLLFLTAAELSSTANGMPPTVSTVSAWSNFHLWATLNGSANPNGEPTTAWFRYSDVNPGACNDTFGIRTSDSSLGSRSVPIPYTQELTGLSALTTYYFCAIAENSSGIGFGEVMSFTTPSTPTMVTLPATALTGYSATLNATVNPNGSTAQVYFRYSSFSGGCNEDFGTRVPMGTGPMISGTSPVAYSEPIISGLIPGYTYYYCSIGQNFEGYTYGPMVSFTTTSELPTVSGTVTYANAIGAPSPRFVSNVSVVIQFSGAPGTTTAPPGPNAGQYSIPVFCFGFCFNTPSKTGGVNGISSNDAARVAQHVSGINVLTGNQLTVADVSGDGTISSFDAAQIARYAAGLGAPVGSTGTWRFGPENYLYHGIMGNYTGQDFTALLMGEVTGNWTNTGARPANAFDPNALSRLIGGF